MARIIKIEPLVCGFSEDLPMSCNFTCFEQATLEHHVRTKHYPEAAENDRAFRRIKSMMVSDPMTEDRDRG